MQLVFATHNAHKVQEVRALLSGSGIEVFTLGEGGIAEEPPETGDTFAANALQKARFAHDLLGLPSLADDSGLEVDALGGQPGVHSKRFAPEGTHDANNRLLLARLAGVRDRAARFRCVLAVVGLGDDLVVDGRCEGAIADAPRGAQGFGYDPLFLPTETPGQTMAELSLEEKNRISHRGRAFRRLAELLTARRRPSTGR